MKEKIQLFVKFCNLASSTILKKLPFLERKKKEIANDSITFRSLEDLGWNYYMYMYLQTAAAVNSDDRQRVMFFAERG